LRGFVCKLAPSKEILILEKMAREGFIFYQSFFHAGKNLPIEHRVAFYDRVLAYGIDNIDEPS